MYPYYPAPNVYGTITNPSFGYNQPMPGSQMRQINPQLINSIESMYTTVQPYQNKQFLLATFGNKPEYIQIFLTLSHEDKLKMYLLMEQKKIYGEMTDKEAYQKILRQIAQKMQNYNNFHQPKVQKIENSDEKKKKELQSKIDSFCQRSFQKLKIPTLGDPKSIAAQKKKYQDVDQIDEWVQSEVVAQNNNEKIPQNNPNSQTVDQYQFVTTLQSNKQNLVNSYTYSNNQAPVIFNMFNFDSDMERAMTKEIGLTDTSKLSIWELQVQQSEIKNNQPRLSEVFRKKEPVVEVKASSIIENIQKTEGSAMSYDIFGHYLPNQAQQQAFYTHSFKNETQQQVFFKNEVTRTTFDSSQLYFQNTNNFSFEIPKSSFNEPAQTNLSNHENIEFNQNQQYTQDQKWNQAQQHSPPQSNYSNSIVTQPSYQQSYQIQTDFVKETNNIDETKMDPPTVPQQEQSNTLFDFDIIQSKVQTQSIMNLDAVDFFLSPCILPKAEIFQQQISQQYRVQLHEIPQQIIQTVVDIDIGPSSILNSQLYLPDNEKKYQLIQHLKVQFSASQKGFIRKQMKNKSFECNAEFYLTILAHLRQVGHQSSSEYEHFTQQYKIVKQMHELTDKYTAVVDEQDQQKVQRALRQSKALYNRIYNKSTISQKLVQHLISDKNKQKGIHYKFGKILIDSCINSDLISKASNQQSRENILKSFCLLFFLEKNNTLNKIKNMTQAVISYTNQQIDRYKSYNDDLLREAQQKFDKYSQTIVYIKGLLKITLICERMIDLMKCCFIKSNANLVKTLKNCKQINNRFSLYAQSQNNRIYPEEYGLMLKNGIEKNLSLYDLHAKFSQVVERLPVCQMCLTEINKQGDLLQQKGWYHYSCFNLMKSINGLEYI